ncbi:MAG: hypothetical protein AAB573_04165 [Patescibacteria group bacterium]
MTNELDPLGSINSGVDETNTGSETPKESDEDGKLGPPRFSKPHIF